MSNPYTYSDPVLSLWQAAVAEVYRSRDSIQNRMAMATSQRMAQDPMAAQTDLMAPVHSLAAVLASGQTPAPASSAPLSIAAQAAKGGPIADCAKTAGDFLWAEISGNDQQSAILAGELQDSECDIGWAQCVTTYLGYKIFGGPLPYRPNLDSIVDLPPQTKVAIIGDWGTGDEVAINLLHQVASMSPDVVIHLGDVYYAGTHNEEQNNFLDICRQILSTNVVVLSMCGNHDMYSGGSGYYWLVDQLSQQASYFCVRNQYWQILAMDTGHNDNNPFTVATNMTSLVTQANWSEAAWHLQKIQQAGTAKTILMSHHQLFSPFTSLGKNNSQLYAYNPNLLTNFQAVLPQVAWWFWGHEHTLAIYDPYMGLQRGRCVGASAVPVFTDQQSYTAAAGLTTYQGGPLPTWNASGQLATNGTDYSHCFAILTLNGPSANVDYYQVPVLGTAARLPVTDNM